MAVMDNDKYKDFNDGVVEIHNVFGLKIKEKLSKKKGSK